MDEFPLLIFGNWLLRLRGYQGSGSCEFSAASVSLEGDAHITMAVTVCSR